MKRSKLAAVLGLALGIVVPFFWPSPLPVFLGAALLVLAGFLSKRGVLAVAGIVAAALLAVSPALVNGYRNRQGIAWTVPEGEQLQLAEGGLAVTSADRCCAAASWGPATVRGSCDCPTPATRCGCGPPARWC